MPALFSQLPPLAPSAKMLAKEADWGGIMGACTVGGQGAIIPAQVIVTSICEHEITAEYGVLKRRNRHTEALDSARREVS